MNEKPTHGSATTVTATSLMAGNKNNRVNKERGEAKKRYTHSKQLQKTTT